jgi:hypothetical protein
MTDGRVRNDQGYQPSMTGCLRRHEPATVLSINAQAHHQTIPCIGAREGFKLTLGFVYTPTSLSAGAQWTAAHGRQGVAARHATGAVAVFQINH